MIKLAFQLVWAFGSALLQLSAWVGWLLGQLLVAAMRAIAARRAAANQAPAGPAPPPPRASRRRTFTVPPRTSRPGR